MKLGKVTINTPIRSLIKDSIVNRCTTLGFDTSFYESNMRSGFTTRFPLSLKEKFGKPIDYENQNPIVTPRVAVFDNQLIFILATHPRAAPKDVCQSSV